MSRNFFVGKIEMPIFGLLSGLFTDVKNLNNVYDDTEHLLHQLMKHFVKKSLMKDADSVAKLVKIDVTSKDNWCSYKEVDNAVAANKVLATVSLSDLKRMKFRMQCSELLSAAVAFLVLCQVPLPIIKCWLKEE